MSCREIKFRALELETAIIRYGSYVAEDGYYMCNGSADYDRPTVRHKICEDGYYCDVAGHTVCQYTGLKDKNGVEIYDGDILKHFDGEIRIVAYDNKAGSFALQRNDKRRKFVAGMTDYVYYQVIGNIHENTELLNL